MLFDEEQYLSFVCWRSINIVVRDLGSSRISIKAANDFSLIISSQGEEIELHFDSSRKRK